MAKKKNEWLYRALCAALAVTLVSGTAVMSPIADIIGTNITANAADYTTWETCQWKVENGKLYIKGTIPNAGSSMNIPWCADSSIRNTITEVYVETGTKTSANVSYLFYNLTKATSMNLSNLDTSAATDMHHMFNYCSSLASLNISGWNTSKVTDMRDMFYYCHALTSLDLSSWNTSSVKTMEDMFYGCNALTSLNLSNWNTKNVTTMAYMFYGCNSLKSVDVNGWNTQNVTSMFCMFSGCKALKKIYADKNWNTSNVENDYSMFGNCENLVGGKGTAWIDTEKNKEYARIDGGPESTTPGYFTQGHAPLTYTVTWKNYDGTTLETDEDVEEGTTPSYDGATPTKTATAQYSYTFSGWDTTPVAVTGNATYTAQFTETTNTYTVTWVDGDGNTLKTDTVAYGKTPVYSGATPTKTATAQYTYTFSGWDKAIAAVTGDVTYTAQFSDTVNEYTVTWIDGDGNTLTTDTVAYGETPTYDGATPEKTATAQYTYTFSGWDNEPTAVTGNATYTAQFTETTNTYTVTWVDGDGNTLKTDTVAYGETPTYDGATPIKIQDDEYAYTFSGWTDGINTYEPNNTLPAVKSDVTYTATFVSGIKSIVNDRYYYVDDQLVKGFGMIKYQGDYYYVKKNGAVLRDMLLNVTADKTNGLVPAGKYKFDTDGKMVVKEDGIIVGDCYYADGKLAKGAGLVEVDGDYYYVRANGAIYKNVSLNVTEEKTNGLVVAGEYKFDADGKMVINGIVDGYYYADGKLAKGVGLIEVDGAYYYIKANGAIYKNASLNVTAAKANGLVPAGKYFFDSEGKMIIA